MKLNTSAHWSNYWSEGNLTSVPRLPANYDGEVLAFWHEQFAALDAHATVLDVCSGNGAIALLAQDYSDTHKLQFRVKANDAAFIDVTAVTTLYPALLDKIESIEFRGDIPFENLDEKPRSFDLITSQYGIEYTNLETAAGKVATLLKPGGRFACISHAPGSDMLAVMKQENEDFSAISDSGLFQLEDTLTNHVGHRVHFPIELDHVLNYLHQEAQSRKSRFLLAVGRELEPLCNAVDGEIDGAVEQFIYQSTRLRYALLRLQDLMQVERRINQEPPWIRTFTNMGLKLERTGDIKQYGTQLIGSYYQLSKLEP